MSSPIESPKKVALKIIKKACDAVGIEGVDIKVEWPTDYAHGDISTNVALVASKILKTSPIEIAKKLADNINDQIKNKSDEALYLEKADAVAPGFVNIYFSENGVKNFLSKDTKGNSAPHTKPRKVMVEYTDPNPFKIFHIGHLMANAIGESFARIIESDGTEVVRTCYQGDVGLHVAKTIWAIQKKVKESPEAWPSDDTDCVAKVKFLGEMYVIGSNAYDDESEGGADAKIQITDINKKLFEKSEQELNRIYDAGRFWSLEYFENIYKRVGTKFDQYYFESDVADVGVGVVKDFLKKGVFEESEGAIIYPGEKHGTHTRVFITQKGLPTYETKELGLNKKKFDMYPDLDQSVIVTGNEQNDYFKVLLSAMRSVYKEVAEKTTHKSHGIMRFKEGKMSSRKGNIISAEDLIDEVRSMVIEKMQSRLDAKNDEMGQSSIEKIVEQIAIGAIKYVILRQSIGSDIIYDPKTAVSFEGDSGPYLQYSCVRARSVLKKAESMGIKPDITADLGDPHLLERLFVRYNDIVDRARREFAPQYIVTYLTELSLAFNTFYAKESIADAEDIKAGRKVYITKKFEEIMEKGLNLLAISVPEKM